MKKMTGILCFGLFFLASSSLFALTALPTGTEVDVSYQEPNTNVDGSALQDLKETRIYYDFGEGQVLIRTVSATSLNGNGNISEKVIIPIGENQERNVQIWATAVDIGNNESEKSDIAVVRIDRLPPSAPR